MKTLTQILKEWRDDWLDGKLDNSQKEIDIDLVLDKVAKAITEVVESCPKSYSSGVQSWKSEIMK